jgi:hypothetical protein
MSKYEPLGSYLRSLKEDSWEASFDDIEKVLRSNLPPSASDHNAWWANEARGSHVQKRAWIDSGWETRNVDLKAKRLRFVRKRRSGDAHASSKVENTPLEPTDLWQKARQLTGIEDRGALVEAGLLALIQREAGRRLIAMGGTMPEAAAAPRERPFE